MFLFFTIFFTVYTALNYYVFIRGWQALTSYSYLRPYYIIVFVFVAYGYIFSKLLYKFLPPLVYDIWLGVGAIWFAFLVYFILILLGLDLIRLLEHFFQFLPKFIQSLRVPIFITIEQYFNCLDLFWIFFYKFSSGVSRTLRLSKAEMN